MNFDSIETDSISRLGSQRDELSQKHRPIKIKLDNADHKFKLLKSARKLSEYTRHSKIGLSKDKTKKERLADQVLRVDLGRMRAADPSKDFTIFRNKIVPRATKQNIIDRESQEGARGNDPRQGAPGSGAPSQ